MKRVAWAAALAAVAIIPAQAADLGRAPPRAAVPAYAPAMPMLWNGFYIGGHLGYGSSTSSASYAGTTLGASPEMGGFFAGGQIGYNFQFSPNFVFGLEADISGTDQDGTAILGPWTGRSEMNVFGTVRGRVGYAFHNLLFYGTGGFAWGHNTLTVSPAPNGITSVSRTHFGWTAGGGIEYAFTPNWSAKAEYLYMDLGNRDYAFGLTSPLKYRPDMHTFKLGVNYRFNWDAPGRRY